MTQPIIPHYFKRLEELDSIETPAVVFMDEIGVVCYYKKDESGKRRFLKRSEKSILEYRIFDYQMSASQGNIIIDDKLSEISLLHAEENNSFTKRTYSLQNKILQEVNL
ncbi:MAG: hypothetical protein AABW65_03010 [Nanoarchaeota archaeon]